MKIIGIIPARKGSKSIPLKNLKDFCGKPLIAWSIISAKKSKLDRVIVSTDSTEIAKIAKSFGAETPYLQPANISGDAVGMETILKYAYEWLINKEDYKPDALMLLQSTSPLRQTFQIDEMIKIFKETNADSVVAVNETPANHTPYWTLTKDPNGKVSMWGGTPLKDMIVRRQDFPQKCYARNDLGYILKPSNLYNTKPNLYGDKVELYITADAHKYEADINTPSEWAEAEIKFQHLNTK